jgi:large subunit ribosomal protein L15
MQINNLKRKTENKKSQLVGRGGKRGKTAGRGTKGQKARAGRKIRPEIRDVIKRIPKMRGRGKNSNISFYKKPVVVNLGDISKAFSATETVTKTSLVQKSLISSYNGGGAREVKILGTGDITKKITFKGLTISASAKAKIEKAGGKIYG